MNESEQRIRDLLAESPIDDAFRVEHRDKVRELAALQAFDEAAAASPAAVRLGNFARPQTTRRRTVRLAVYAVAAASICGALVAWSLRSDPGPSPKDLPDQRTVARSEADAAADEQLIAALNLLSEYDAGRASATFDLGIQACLGERLSQIASVSHDAFRPSHRQSE